MKESDGDDRENMYFITPKAVNQYACTLLSVDALMNYTHLKERKQFTK